MHEVKRLYRSKTNYVIGGILGGLGEYFNVDPALFRVAFLVLMIFTAFVPGILAYILALLVIPPHPDA